jgi:acyl-CoA dehydrogenase
MGSTSGYECTSCLWWWIGGAAGLAVVFAIAPIRRVLFSSWIMPLLKRLGVLPSISETERVALKAGDVWVEKEFFKGKPDFKSMLSVTYPQLTAEEQAFVDGPCEELCRMVDDWKVWQEHDLPKEVWDFIKKKGFLGMIIPKQYGGLGFSALAHSAVLMKLASRSSPLCITVMVPNSLGPAELLNHYGTEEQKSHYLPRLARGEEVPCFGLTEPNAGSDAGSITSTGELFKGDDGKLQIKLNWNKRWITLAGVSTVIGLAFRLKDPKNLLGKGEDLGITCALIPRNTPGVKADRRHNPLGIPFYNCPTQGKDVVVPIDVVIGGVEGCGHGWKMLMECLAAGRGISLPAQATAMTKLTARVAGAHATVRKQFGLSIGMFEGVREPLARIAGVSYLLEATRKYTLAGIDMGKKPPVVTAMAKYYFTELQRMVVNDGMDIVGGQAISKGPRNLLAHAYMTLPISITVEGANILTRTLIIFGQGALRAHPYAFRVVDALERNSLKDFDSAFWGHIFHILKNSVRSVFHTATRGWFIIPATWGLPARYLQKLGWASSVYAFMADVAMGSFGPALKAKGKTTGRYADLLAWMYIATATVRRFEAEGRKEEDVPLFKWSMDYCFWHMQKAFEELYANFDAPIVGWLFRGPIRWMTGLNPIGMKPRDTLDHQLASIVQKPGDQRDRLTAGIHVPKDTGQALGRLENAFVLSVQADGISRKVSKAVKAKRIKKASPVQMMNAAVEAGVITKDEADVLAKAEAARWDAIQVDDFGLKMEP